MLDCPIESPRITQPFGGDKPTYSNFGLDGHDGIDMTGPISGILVPIHAPFDGIVTDVGDQGKKGYGMYVRIRSAGPNKDGNWRECVFGHLSAKTVFKGDRVNLGDAFATMGNTGFSFGAHLHWGLRFLDKNFSIINYGNGYFGYVNPLPWTRFWRSDPRGLVTFVRKLL